MLSLTSFVGVGNNVFWSKTQKTLLYRYTPGQAGAPFGEYDSIIISASDGKGKAKKLAAIKKGSTTSWTQSNYSAVHFKKKSVSLKVKRHPAEQ